MVRTPFTLPMVALAALLLPSPAPGQVDLGSGREMPRILPNDNRRPAGRLEVGVLSLRLEAREGMWHPHGFDRDGIRIG
ncbi:MAG: hypothetical protein ACRELU_07700, partial [Gemmatimonadota bacterium]